MKQTTAPVVILIACTAICALLVGCGASTDQSEEVATEVSVHVAKVKRVTLHAYVNAYGLVETELANNTSGGGGARLAAPVTGIVTAVPVREGDRVAAGAVVVRLDDRAALGAMDKAQQDVESATRAEERQDKLKAIDGTSERAVQEAAQQLAAARAELSAAKAQLAQVHLATPVSGVVAKINVQPGQSVDFNTVVAEVVDLTRLIVTVSVTPVEAMGLKTGQSADILPGDNDQALAPAKVLFVSPTVDAKTGAVVVRLALPPSSGLRPGQYVRARIASDEHADCLAVPKESVVTDDDGHSFIATVSGDTAEQNAVQVGLRDGDLIEVTGDGLKEGDTVVSVGAYGLPKKSKIRVIDGIN